MREIKHLSVHQWLRSAIPDSQQPVSPIGFLFLKLPPPPCAVLLVQKKYTYISACIYIYTYVCVCPVMDIVYYSTIQIIISPGARVGQRERQVQGTLSSVCTVARRFRKIPTLCSWHEKTVQMWDEYEINWIWVGYGTQNVGCNQQQGKIMGIIKNISRIIFHGNRISQWDTSGI